MTDKAPLKPTGLALLREPFPANQISKLPKATKRQTEEVRADFKKGIRCQLCGQWHHPDVVHLDYVGHAALTDRLLDCDLAWNWEPVATREDGTPAFDANGGMWIKLTVCGQTRLGYGHPDGKTGGDAIKECIGDALRNAAMRFGAALDLWHKGDLHGPAQDDETDKAGTEPTPDPDHPGAKATVTAPSPTEHAINALNATDNLAALAAIWADLPTSVKATPGVIKAKDRRKAELSKAPDPARQAPPVEEMLGDDIPY
jgi:hypothetical protein